MGKCLCLNNKYNKIMYFMYFMVIVFQHPKFSFSSILNTWLGLCYRHFSCLLDMLTNVNKIFPNVIELETNTWHFSFSYIILLLWSQSYFIHCWHQDFFYLLACFLGWSYLQNLYSKVTFFFSLGSINNKQHTLFLNIQHSKNFYVSSCYVFFSLSF